MQLCNLLPQPRLPLLRQLLCVGHLTLPLAQVAQQLQQDRIRATGEHNWFREMHQNKNRGWSVAGNPSKCSLLSVRTSRTTRPPSPTHLLNLPLQRPLRALSILK